MAPRLGALILFASDLTKTVEFYRTLGLPLVVDEHEEEGPEHFACDLDGCHFAVFPAAEKGIAPGMGQAGASFPGFEVDSLAVVLDALRPLGAEVLQEPSE